MEQKTLYNLNLILAGISSEQKERMIAKGKEVYASHFTIEAITAKILKEVG